MPGLAFTHYARGIGDGWGMVGEALDGCQGRLGLPALAFGHDVGRERDWGQQGMVGEVLGGVSLAGLARGQGWLGIGDDAWNSFRGCWGAYRGFCCIISLPVMFVGMAWG